MADDILWLRKEYGELPTYRNIEDCVKLLQEALAAQERGEWKDLYLEIQEEQYDSGHLISISGQRPENAAEKALRVYDRANVEKREREQYERLREKYGTEQEKKD